MTFCHVYLPTSNILISLSFRDVDVLRDEVIFANSDADEYVALSMT